VAPTFFSIVRSVKEPRRMKVIDYRWDSQVEETTPMDTEELLRSKREQIMRLAESHGAHNVRVFGSVVRGEAGPESDIDLLIDLEAGRSLLQHAALLVELEDLLGRKVDIVTERSLRPHVRERILSEAQPL
jgi:uncharacterized protein